MASSEVIASKTLLEKVYASSCECAADFAIRFASHPIGQFLLGKTNGVLLTLERAVQWSVPPKVKDPPSNAEAKDPGGSSNGNNARSVSEPPVRPLPWIFFIPLLLVIRAARGVMRVVNWARKKEPVRPKQMVRRIQMLRRRLRVIKFRGLRHARRRSSVAQSEAAVATTTPTQQVASPAEQPDSQLESTFDILQEKKRKFEEIDPNSSADEHENFEEALRRMAQEEEDLENDPDFEPDSTLDSDDLSSDGDMENLENEVADLETDAKEPPRRLLSVIDHVIVEESDESSTMTISLEDEDVLNGLTYSLDKDKFYSPEESDKDKFYSPEESETESLAVCDSQSNVDSLSVSSKGSGQLVASQESAAKKFSNLFSKKDKKGV